VNLVERVRVSGKSCALGKDIEPGKKPEGWIKSVLSNVSVALAAEEFEGKKGQNDSAQQN
jgi:hypothetical protein